MRGFRLFWKQRKHRHSPRLAMDGMFLFLGCGCIAILVLLDVRAAFDTRDHHILHCRLGQKNHLGFTVRALVPFQSYHSEDLFVVFCVLYTKKCFFYFSLYTACILTSVLTTIAMQSQIHIFLYLLSQVKQTSPLN